MPDVPFGGQPRPTRRNRSPRCRGPAVAAAQARASLHEAAVLGGSVFGEAMVLPDPERAGDTPAPRSP